MKIHDCIQYSPEWWSLRAGIPTASQFSRIVKTTRKVADPDKKLRNYVAELLAAKLNPTADYVSEGKPRTQAMINGTNYEPEARKWFMVETDLTVAEVGFLTTDDGRFGCSPDGLIYSDSGLIVGGLELKCPEPKTHMRWLLEGVLPKEHVHQVHGGLAVSDLDQWWFMSYCPACAPQSAFLVHVRPDTFTAEIRQAMKEFDAMYQAALKRFLLT